MNLPRKAGPGFWTEKRKVREREVNLGRETDCTKSRRKKGPACP